MTNPAAPIYTLHCFRTIREHETGQPHSTTGGISSEQKAARMAAYAILGVPESHAPERRFILVECFDQAGKLVFILGGKRGDDNASED